MSQVPDADTPPVAIEDRTHDLARDRTDRADPLLWPIDRPMMFAIAALVVVILACVLSIVFDAQRIHIVNRLEADQATHATLRYATDAAAAKTSDNETAIAGDTQGIAVVAAGLTFLLWFYRAYANLEWLGVRKPRFRLGSAIWGWFVPIMSLFRPKQIANDIWRGSDPSNPGREPDPRGPVLPLIHWWWAAFLLNSFVAVLGIEDWKSGHAPSAVKHAALVDILSCSVSIVAAVLAAASVYALTARQMARARAQADGPDYGHRYGYGAAA
jgi:hypothetical protein